METVELTAADLWAVYASLDSTYEIIKNSGLTSLIGNILNAKTNAKLALEDALQNE